MWLPRIGQEVIVRFLEGDPDRPLVAGAVYGGYEDLLVKKNRSRTVEGDQQLTVLLDDAGVVEGNQTLLVQKDRDTSTGGMRSMLVGGAHWAAVAGSRQESIAANASIKVGGNS